MPARRKPSEGPEVWIPVDVGAAKQLGGDDWRRNFRWPIEPALFPHVCREVLRHYFHVAKRAREDHRFVLLASYKAPLLMLQWIHLLLLERAAGMSGVRLAVRDSEQYAHLLAVSPASRRDVTAALEAPRLAERARVLLWFMRRELATENFASFLRTLSGPEIWVSFAARTRLSERWAESQGVRPLRLPVQLLVGEAKQRACDWGSVRNELTGGFLSISEKYCGVLSCRQRSAVVDYFGAALNQYFALFYSTVEKLSRVPRVDRWRMVSCSLGSPIHRVVGQAVRYLGGHVIGISHSNAFCRPNSYAVTLSEMSICDTFVVGSNAERLSNEFTIDQTRNEFPEAPEFPRERIVSVGNYYKTVSKAGEAPVDLSRGIRSIMVVGAPYVPWQSYFLHGVGGIHWLHAELEIIERLSEAGFRVIYKAHPDRLEEARGFFSGKVARFLEGKFEDVWDQADCVVNMSWATTCFPISLMTGRPTILVDTLGFPWPPAIRRVVERRCVIVKATVNEDSNLVRPDEDSLEDCIRLLKSPERVLRMLQESEGEFQALLC